MRPHQRQLENGPRLRTRRSSCPIVANQIVNQPHIPPQPHSGAFSNTKAFYSAVTLILPSPFRAVEVPASH